MDTANQVYIFNQSDLSEELARKIAYLKKQWWPHPFDEQVSYLKGLAAGDQHVLVLKDDGVASYLRLTERGVKAGNRTYRAGGISTVCTDRRHLKQVLGRKLMAKVADYLLQEKFDFGILACPNEFVEFYSLCGWKKIKAKVFGAKAGEERREFFKCENIFIYPDDFKLSAAGELEILGEPF